jgi:HEAT repeat protein
LIRAAVAGTGDDELLEDALTNPSPRVRVLAVRALAVRPNVDAVTWSTLRDDPEATVRREVIRQLGRHRSGPTTTEILVTALADPDPLVVVEAAHALGEHPDLASRSALEKCATSHPDARAREFAVAALGAVGDRASVPVIIAALRDRLPVRRRAAVALAAFEGPEVDAALASSREDRDWQVRDVVQRLERES